VVSGPEYPRRSASSCRGKAFRSERSGNANLGTRPSVRFLRFPPHRHRSSVPRAQWLSIEVTRIPLLALVLCFRRGVHPRKRSDRSRAYDRGTRDLVMGQIAEPLNVGRELRCASAIALLHLAGQLGASHAPPKLWPLGGARKVSRNGEGPAGVQWVSTRPEPLYIRRRVSPRHARPQACYRSARRRGRAYPARTSHAGLNTLRFRLEPWRPQTLPSACS